MSGPPTRPVCPFGGGLRVLDRGDRLARPLGPVLEAVEHPRRSLLSGCVERRLALKEGLPEIFNTDEGSRFTARVFVGRLEEAGVSIGMGGRGRALGDGFAKRLWRTLKI